MYFRTSKTIFRLWHSNHQRIFKFLKYKADTKISNEVWRKKKSGQATVITLEIVRTFFLTTLPLRDATYAWIKDWKLLPNEEITCWTKKRNWYRNADTKKNYTKDWRRLCCKKLLYCNFPFVKYIPLKIVGLPSTWNSEYNSKNIVN